MVSGEVANSRIDRQTNRQTDKRRVKYNLFGGGKKAKSESLGKLRLFLNKRRCFNHGVGHPPPGVRVLALSRSRSLSFEGDSVSVLSGLLCNLVAAYLTFLKFVLQLKLCF